ncbi:MAG TPA: TonB-dependent receptor [Polyangiaceae bacterium]|nr:TonB-dependent receptor [Polyangiaceae bacterium]
MRSGTRGVAALSLLWAGIARAQSEVATPTASAEAADPPPTEVVVQGPRRVRGQGFSGAEIQKLPGALGDPLRAIEALPGVTPTLSGVPYFFVRGAPPGDVGYFFDGVRLPALFHALGGPSVVHPALIDSVELFPGPYPVEYGKFAAGAVVARATEPAAEPRGELALRATDSSALLDTPLGPSANLTLSGRYSYANPVLHLFSSDTNVQYWDYQARLQRRLSEKSRLTLLAFGAHDSLTDHDNDGKLRTLYGIDFHRAAMRYERQLERGRVALQLLGGWDRSLARDGDVKVDDGSSELKLEVEHGLSRSVRLRTGASAGFDRYALDVGQLDDARAQRRYLARFPSRTDSSASLYLALDLTVNSRIRVTPGVRADIYFSRGERALGVDPRVDAEYRLSSRFVLRSALGVAHQPPSAAVPSPGLNPTLGRGLQTGVQYSYGFRARLPADIGLELTLYQTALFNLTDSIGQSRATETDDRITDDRRGLGRSRGVELLVKRSLTRRLGGFLTYTLSSSERSIGRAHVPSAFDRRHVLGAALGYDWGSGYRTGVRASFYSGIPADVAYVEAAANPPRTPAFYRFDWRAEKRFQLGESRYISLVLEIVNTTLNREVLSESCNAYRCEQRRVGPITIPNLGLEAGF